MFRICSARIQRRNFGTAKNMQQPRQQKRHKSFVFSSYAVAFFGCAREDRNTVLTRWILDGIIPGAPVTLLYIVEDFYRTYSGVIT